MDRVAPAPSVTCSVVICAYTPSRWDALTAAVASVQHQLGPEDELIVVIDHHDELHERADSDLPGAQVIANEGRPGLSDARNTGIRAARSPVVGFLDDDAVAADDWLHHLLAPYTEESVIGVGGLVLPRWAAGRRPHWFPAEFDWVVGCSYTGLPETRSVVRNPIGANMSFRREPLVAAGGFSTSIGRVGTRPLGCEETEVGIRLAQLHPTSVIVHEPAAVVHHHVPSARAAFSYFRSRCWSEGLSKAEVARLSDQRRALEAERRYVRSTLPRGVVTALGDVGRRRDPSGLGRATAVVAGVALTAGGYATGRLSSSRSPKSSRTQKDTHMARALNVKSTPIDLRVEEPDSEWLHFDVHGLVGIRVDRSAPTAPQLRTMLACFATDEPVPPDIVVTSAMEPMVEAANLEDELSYTSRSIQFHHEQVQIVHAADQYRIHGSGELLTALVPVLDRAMVERGAAMFHAATVAYRGMGIALPAAGGTGKTSTIAKLMRRPEFSFMGDDWAFLSAEGDQLGYAKPMFIKPHHRPIYPHLFAGARKPLVPTSLSKPIGRLTTIVHPVVVRYPRLADVSRRWSPEHRMVAPAKALPNREIATTAPLALSVYIERYQGARTRLRERSLDWMVDRMIGNFHIEMASFSQQLVSALGATSVLPQRQHFDEKAAILTRALQDVPCYVLQVPSVLSPDHASDDIVRELDDLVVDVAEVPAAAVGGGA